MRRFLLTMALTATAFGVVKADGYGFLTLEDSNGASQSVVAVGTRITFVDGNITATNGTSAVSMPLSKLARLYFSDTSTGIEGISTDKGEAEVTTVSGVSVGHFSTTEQMRAALAKGVYIVRQNGKTFKIAVR